MSKSRSRSLVDLSAPQAVEVLTTESILVQPVGSVEQHGEHLPLSTDLVIAEATSQAVVDQHGDELDLWLLPTLSYSKSNEHAWAAGTIWLSAVTLLAVLNDLGRSLAKLPAVKLAFINGHGGNSSLLNVACRELRIDHGLMTFLLHPSVPPDQGGPSAPAEMGMGIHGGLDETSMMLHLRPGLVDMAKTSRSVPEHLAANTHLRFGGDVSFGWVSADFGSSGVIGDPTAANADRGATLFDSSVTALGEALAEVRRFRFPGGESNAE